MLNELRVELQTRLHRWHDGFQVVSVIPPAMKDGLFPLSGSLLLLQLAHPSIARAVYEHSDYANRPLDRLFGRALFVNEDTEITNFGEHLMRRTIEELFYELAAPPRLLAGAFVPGIGLADNLEMASVPQLPSIRQAIADLAAMEA